MIKLPCLFHRDQDLTSAPLRLQTDLLHVDQELGIVGLLGVRGHAGRLVLPRCQSRDGYCLKTCDLLGGDDTGV